MTSLVPFKPKEVDWVKAFVDMAEGKHPRLKFLHTKRGYWLSPQKGQGVSSSSIKVVTPVAQTVEQARSGMKARQQGRGPIKRRMRTNSGRKKVARRKKQTSRKKAPKKKAARSRKKAVRKKSTRKTSKQHKKSSKGKKPSKGKKRVFFNRQKGRSKSDVLGKL